MDEDRNKEPAERMRAIISSSDDESNAQFQPISEPEPEKPQLGSQSLLDKLPRMNPASQTPPRVEQEEALPKPEARASSEVLDNLPRSDQPVDSPAHLEKPPEKLDMPRREKFLRALWTLTSAISMMVNVVVIIFFN